MVLGKRNLSVIVVVLLALLLIALVIWVYDKKMQETSKQMHRVILQREDVVHLKMFLYTTETMIHLIEMSSATFELRYGVV